jgi:hypothetical protein
MGGISETYIGSLRIHINGDVHIHDDTRNIKLEIPKDKFKDDISEALSILGKDDGVYIIEVNMEHEIILIQSDGKLNMILNRRGSHLKALNNFIKGL